jgi:hypothetical protein
MLGAALERGPITPWALLDDGDGHLADDVSAITNTWASQSLLALTNLQNVHSEPWTSVAKKSVVVFCPAFLPKRGYRFS